MAQNIGRRKFLTASGSLLGYAALSSLSAQEHGSKHSKPNIVLIFADDLGYGDLGCYGSELIKTPHIDKMASEGVRFTDFYTASNICTPSRVALLTGCYPQRIGLYTGINPIRDQHKNLGLHPQENTIGKAMKERGYATLCIGKWHLGGDDLFHPMNHGFDEYYGMPFNYNHSGIFMKNRKVVAEDTDLSVLTERYTKRVVDFIERNKSNPFFVYLPHSYPHKPLIPNSRFKGKSNAGAYGDIVEELDWSTGKILEKIRALGLDDNTIVIFTSDNGPEPEHALDYGSSGAFRGWKYATWEGGHRVPFIIRWPGHVPAGEKCEELACMMDFLPTLANRAGGKMSEHGIDGYDIWPLISNPSESTSPRDVFYYYNMDHLQAIRWKRWKIHLPRRPENLPFWERDLGPGEGHLEEPLLFDLVKDPGETKNVASEQPEVIRHMMEHSVVKARHTFGDHDRVGKKQRPTIDSRMH